MATDGVDTANTNRPYRCGSVPERVVLPPRHACVALRRATSVHTCWIVPGVPWQALRQAMMRP